MSKRIRYRIADVLNRLPGTCCTKLVMWVEFRHPLRDTRVDAVCFADGGDPSWPCCYCGKRMKPE